MIQKISRTFWRGAVQLWLANSQHSWRRLPVANDSPHVHAPGSNPDRVLIAGDGASAGVGVITHDLGLPGYLARGLSLLTLRATDVDIAVTTGMTVTTCLDALKRLELSRFDVILLSLGSNEALSFMNPAEWSAQLGRLLNYIHANSPTATKTVMLSVPAFGKRSQFPRMLRTVVDRHAELLNEITATQISTRENVLYLPFQAGDDLESDGSHTYERWAAGLAPEIARELRPQWGESERTETMHEQSRLDALNALGLLDMPPDTVLDEIVTTAKELFGAPMAGITFIDKERQSTVAVVGMSAGDIPRADAFCDITIRRAQHFVIEDASLDPRYADNPVVINPPNIRFYAGYPIEAPNGQRVGALCIMDTDPRQFSDLDTALLRDLAQRAQDRLWVLSRNASSAVL